MTVKDRNFRLYAVGAAFAAVTLVIWARLVQIQVFGRERYRSIAEDQWTVRRAVPPVRGGVFDRHRKPLALSIRSCSVSLRPAEVKNRKKVVSVLARHLGLPAQAVEKKVRSDKSFVWVKRQCTLTEKARREIKALGGVEIHLEADRIYPYGLVASKVVGFVGHDNEGMAGAEAVLNAELSGTPGWEVVQRDGAYRSNNYHLYAEKKPQNGKHVILTIDADLQQIAELELERAVAANGARGGVLIAMHCETGEVLALAEYPGPRSREPGSLVDSLWTMSSVSRVYEPGSTFKLITAAALIETQRVRSFDVFDAENGRAHIGPAVISDAHPHGHLTFREAFAVSSNIVLAKASLKLPPADFYRFVRLFGFGERTGLRMFGESSGQVPPIEKWSKRTQITMAFGQEIAVTPLQMAAAFSAVANDGVLMEPMIVKSVVDESTGETITFEPVVVRRVVSEETAQLLREYCREVVEEGTGEKAAISFLRVAGKTGTAEKAAPRGGYLANKFVASFIGFAPVEDPKVTCLVLLDEPDYYGRFGGVSAAPVFARVTEAIANKTPLFESTTVEELPDQAVEESDAAPNFLRLSQEAAMERARGLELNVRCEGKGGEVVAQDPDPGVAMDRDETLVLHLGGSPAQRVAAPDLRGLPMREAKRRAIAAGLRCEVVGSGFVDSQTPAPGAVPTGGVVTLICNRGTRRGVGG